MLLDGRGDGGRGFIHLADAGGDVADRTGGGFGGVLDGLDLGGDFHRCLAGLGGEGFNLGGDDGEAFASIPGTGGLDGGVERQQVGLPGDIGDQFNDIADFFGSGREALHLGVGLLGLLHALLDEGAGLPDLLADLADGGREFLRRRGDGVDVLGCFLGRGGDGGGLAGGFLGRGGHGLCGGMQLGGGGGDMVDHTTDAGFKRIGQREHGAPAGLFGLLLLRLLLGAQVVGFDHIGAEGLQGADHGADFIGAIVIRQGGLQVALAERLHRGSYGDDRTRNATTDEPGQRGDQQHDADHDDQGELARGGGSGLAVRSGNFGVRRHASIEGTDPGLNLGIDRAEGFGRRLAGLHTGHEATEFGLVGGDFCEQILLDGRRQGGYGGGEFG